ncbi:MAG: dolichyl-phosphate beta-glucosyltransferase [Thermoanaerobaculales bacterium]|jgi:dolichyl-phosphate beta-glucosyltransferase|nr:dolichyl-phosphate beta-glucosyltransferase [Thermoanaerobaculales bacterium]
MRLSVVIPAYNEASRLPATLDEIVGYLSRHPTWCPAEIVVVDDGSADATFTVARRAATADGVTIVCRSHSANHGKGAAVRSGFRSSRGEHVLLSDADMATPISEIERLAGAAPLGIAVGSRAVDRGRIQRRQPLHRDLMGRVFNLAVRCLAIGGINDTQCGFKLFHGDLARELAAAQRIDGFAYDVELLARARRWGFEIREVSVRWSHVEASRVQPLQHSTEMFLDLLRISYWRLTGKLDPPEPSEE